MQDKPKKDQLKAIVAPAMIWIGRLPISMETIKISVIAVMGAAVVGGYLGKLLSAYGYAAIDMRIVGAMGAGIAAMLARIIRYRG